MFLKVLPQQAVRQTAEPAASVELSLKQDVNLDIPVPKRATAEHEDLAQNRPKGVERKRLGTCRLGRRFTPRIAARGDESALAQRTHGPPRRLARDGLERHTPRRDRRRISRLGVGARWQ